VSNSNPVKKVSLSIISTQVQTQPQPNSQGKQPTSKRAENAGHKQQPPQNPLAPAALPGSGLKVIATSATEGAAAVNSTAAAAGAKMGKIPPLRAGKYKPLPKTSFIELSQVKPSIATGTSIVNYKERHETSSLVQSNIVSEPPMLKKLEEKKVLNHLVPQEAGRQLQGVPVVALNVKQPAVIALATLVAPNANLPQKQATPIVIYANPRNLQAQSNDAPLNARPISRLQAVNTYVGNPMVPMLHVDLPYGAGVPTLSLKGKKFNLLQVLQQEVAHLLHIWVGSLKNQQLTAGSTILSPLNLLPLLNAMPKDMRGLVLTTLQTFWPRLQQSGQRFNEPQSRWQNRDGYGTILTSPFSRLIKGSPIKLMGLPASTPLLAVASSSTVSTGLPTAMSLMPTNTLAESSRNAVSLWSTLPVSVGAQSPNSITSSFSVSGNLMLSAEPRSLTLNRLHSLDERPNNLQMGGGGGATTQSAPSTVIENHGLLQNLQAANLAKILNSNPLTLPELDGSKEVKAQGEESDPEGGYCPGCGEANYCCASTPGTDAKECWCQGLPMISSERLKKLDNKTQQKNCLCINCLSELFRQEGLLPKI
jgi:hypothetical protein